MGTSVRDRDRDPQANKSPPQISKTGFQPHPKAPPPRGLAARSKFVLHASQPSLTHSLHSTHIHAIRAHAHTYTCSRQNLFFLCASRFFACLSSACSRPLSILFSSHQLLNYHHHHHVQGRHHHLGSSCSRFLRGVLLEQESSGCSRHSHGGGG